MCAEKHQCILPIIGSSVPNGSFAIAAAHEIVRGNEQGSDNYLKWLLERHNNCCYDYFEKEKQFSIFLYDDIAIFRQSMDRQEIEVQQGLLDALHIDLLLSLRVCLAEQNYIQCKINGRSVESFCQGENFSDESQILLYGFDDAKQCFYGRAMTADFVMTSCEIPYQDITKVLFSADEKTTWLDFWFYWWKVGDSNVYEKFSKGINDYINSCNSSSAHSVNRVFGIKAIEALMAEMRQNIESNQSINLLQISQFLNHKFFLKEKLRHIVEIKNINSKGLESAEKVYALAQKIYAQARQYNEKRTVGELLHLMQQTIEEERSYMPAVLLQISDSKNSEK